MWTARWDVSGGSLQVSGRVLESSVLCDALFSGHKDLERTPTMFANYLNLRGTELLSSRTKITQQVLVRSECCGLSLTNELI